MLLPFPPLDHEMLRTFARQQTSVAVFAWIATAISGASATASHIWFGASNRPLTAVAGLLTIAGLCIASIFTSGAVSDWKHYRKAKARDLFRG